MRHCQQWQAKMLHCTGSDTSPPIYFEKKILQSKDSSVCVFTLLPSPLEDSSWFTPEAISDSKPQNIPINPPDGSAWGLEHVLGSVTLSSRSPSSWVKFLSLSAWNSNCGWFKNPVYKFGDYVEALKWLICWIFAHFSSPLGFDPVWFLSHNLALSFKNELQTSLTLGFWRKY